LHAFNCGSPTSQELNDRTTEQITNARGKNFYKDQENPFNKSPIESITKTL